MKLKQFPQGDTLNGAKAFGVVVAKKRLGFGGAKTLNHTFRVLRHALYVNDGRFDSHLVEMQRTSKAFTAETLRALRRAGERR
jgi:hypothetical protein